MTMVFRREDLDVLTLAERFDGVGKPAVVGAGVLWFAFRLLEKEVREMHRSGARLVREVGYGVREFVKTGLISAPIGWPGEAVGRRRSALGLARSGGVCVVALKRCFSPFRQAAI